MSKERKKVVIAAGGTGGHLFPAQALAEELKRGGADIVFMGAGLENSRYFDRAKYPYFDIPSANLFRKNILTLFPSLLRLGQGVKHSLQILKREEPDLVIGFGSFHAFPILCAARLQTRVITLFESNAYPGKVNRLFSSSANYTAIVFPPADHHLRGKTVEVAMPVRKTQKQLSVEAARGYFGLDPRYPTLLLFGGSQGAVAMNELCARSMETLKPYCSDFQVIHIAGNPQSVERLKKIYLASKIKACVKDFEQEMAIAYQAASLAICRAGAATISELLACELPAILIPFPYAADDHQSKNAHFFEQEVKGGIYLPEKGLTHQLLAREIYHLLDPSRSSLERMKKSLHTYKLSQDKRELWTVIWETLHQQ